MILNIEIKEKSFGDKRLMENVKFSIDDGEKIGLIGRNGIGKSTLFGMILGSDKDYEGEVIFRKNVQIASTLQEYTNVGEKTVKQFILNDLPEYAELNKIITELPEKMGDNLVLIEEYTDALERFSQKDFHFVEEKIRAELFDFSLGNIEDKKMSELSGGQKRLVDTIKIIQSKADLALVDEPTNFMDFAAKKRFLDWMMNANESVVVITHDRDVLKQVDKIIEIKDGKSFIFKGNYDDYLRQNAFSTSNQMSDYENVQRRILNLKDKVREYQRMKEKSRSDSTIQRFKRLEQKSREELAQLQELNKPTFWIDKDNVSNLGTKAAKSYDKFKAQNVRINMNESGEKSKRSLVRAEKLSIGYGSLENAIEQKNGAKLLFENLNFDLNIGGILEVYGRNGAGKSSLIKAIFNAQNKNAPNVFAGEISLDPTIRLGEYVQEIEPDFFEMNLKDAIEKIYFDQDLVISETKVRQIMYQYLFNQGDFGLKIKQLSGGQKARFQLIKMLSNDPQLVVLDEPTSHLDLPSIEELENALKTYSGAVIFVSHDDYFREAMRKSEKEYKEIKIGV